MKTKTKTKNKKGSIKIDRKNADKIYLALDGYEALLLKYNTVRNVVGVDGKVPPLPKFILKGLDSLLDLAAKATS